MAEDTKSVAELAAETKAAFEKKFDTVKEIAEKAVAEAEKGVPLATTAKELADEALLGMNEAKSRLDELEQKMARKGADEREAFKTAGYQVIEDEGVKAFMANPTAGKRIGVDVEGKAIISGLATVADGSAGDLVVPQRGPLVDGVERRMTVRDLLTPGRTNSSSIQYPVETGFTNSAATVTETAGTAKPQSELQFDIRTASVTTIAHWVLATRQILDDAPMLQSYIDGRLRYGLRYAEEAQLLNGDGTGTNLNGIYTQATATTANLAVVASPTKLDVLRYAMLQASLAEFPATGIVIHPTDWANIETTKDGDGRYIIATEDSDNFRKNLVTILAEERLALAVYRPLAFVKGDFSDQVTDLTS
jgi:HK97 family phage major capsid protein